MKRGDLYRVAHPSGDTKKYRVFVIVSRKALIATRFSTVICAPVYSEHDGLSTQIAVGIEEGLKHDSSVHCDALMSIPKASLTHYIGTLPPDKLAALDKALCVALELRC
jgi:mRNA interferase MazF